MMKLNYAIEFVAQSSVSRSYLRFQVRFLARTSTRSTARIRKSFRGSRSRVPRSPSSKVTV